ncbi:MAG: hypothetical protein R3E10_11380 [Gemmatimonadota bacterium]
MTAMQVVRTLSPRQRWCALLNRFFAHCDSKKPYPCLPLPKRLLRIVPVTVWVGDWGGDVDDIFEVRFDGRVVLHPPAPVTKATTTFDTYAGSHVVHLTGVLVPDDIGTFQMGFSPNVKVVSGPLLKGLNLGQGVTFTYHVLVD